MPFTSRQLCCNTFNHFFLWRGMHGGHRRTYPWSTLSSACSTKYSQHPQPLLGPRVIRPPHRTSHLTQRSSWLNLPQSPAPESSVLKTLGTGTNSHQDLYSLHCQYKGKCSARFVFCLFCLSAGLKHLLTAA